MLKTVNVFLPLWIFRPTFKSGKNAEGMETILGEEFIKMWVRNINYCKNETAIFFSRYIYPDKDNLKISDENSSKKENPDIQTLEHLKVSFLEDIVLFHLMISFNPWSVSFLD